MKYNLLLIPMLILSLTGFSLAGECTHGLCNRPSGRTLLTTKTITKEVVRLPRKVVNGCVNDRCNSRSVIRVR